MKQDKCHFLFAGHTHEQIFAKAGLNKIWESQREQLLGVYLGKDLSFKYHVSNLCKKAHTKLTALIRLGRFHDLSQRRLLMKSFIESQFGYSPLVWMFHDRGVNAQINKLHERVLRFVYSDNLRSFEDLLEMDGSLSIHHRNIHTVALEMFKVTKGVSNQIMEDIFVKREINADTIWTRSLCRNYFVLPQVNTVHYGHDSLRFFGYKIWNLLPEDIKNCQTVDEFKRGIKDWVPNLCPCRLCKFYLGGVGYVNI